MKKGTTPASAVSNETPIPVIESVSSAPVVTFDPVTEYVSENAAHAAPIAVTEHVAPASVVFHPVPPPVTEYVASTISTSLEWE